MSMYTAMMHMWNHEFAASVAWAEKAIRQNPRVVPALRVMVVGLVHSKQPDRAKEIVGEILRIDPKFSISGWRRQSTPQHPDNNQRWQFILDAFRAAGVPE